MTPRVPQLFPAELKKTVDIRDVFAYTEQAIEQCADVEKSRSLVERARLEIVYTP